MRAPFPSCPLLWVSLPRALGPLRSLCPAPPELSRLVPVGPGRGPRDSQRGRAQVGAREGKPRQSAGGGQLPRETSQQRVEPDGASGAWPREGGPIGASRPGARTEPARRSVPAAPAAAAPPGPRSPAIPRDPAPACAGSGAAGGAGRVRGRGARGSRGALGAPRPSSPGPARAAPLQVGAGAESSGRAGRGSRLALSPGGRVARRGAGPARGTEPGVAPGARGTGR